MRTIRLPATLKDGGVVKITIPVESVDGVEIVRITGHSDILEVDLFPLRKTKTLGSLSIERNEKLKTLDITPLSILANLQHLAISWNPSLKELHVATIPHLRQLTVYMNRSLPSLDLSFLEAMIDLHRIEISYNSTLQHLNLRPVRKLLGLQQLVISNNWNLSELDLSPLSELKNLHELVITGNKHLSSLDLSPLAGLDELQVFQAYGNDGIKELDLSPLIGMESLRKVDVTSRTYRRSILESETIKKVAPLIFKQINQSDFLLSLDPIQSYSYLNQLVPIIEEYESPWKLHHLTRSLLLLLDLGWLGFLDISSIVLSDILKSYKRMDFETIAREKIIKLYKEQIEASGVTIGLEMNKAKQVSWFALNASRIVDLRWGEVEDLDLCQEGDVIDLQLLHLTAYGYEILKHFNLGMTCTVNDFTKVESALRDVGLSIRHRVSKVPVLPQKMSKSLCEYILHLVDYRKEKA